jgi:hypothetical protein
MVGIYFKQTVIVKKTSEHSFRPDYDYFKYKYAKSNGRMRDAVTDRTIVYILVHTSIKRQFRLSIYDAQK